LYHRDQAQAVLRVAISGSASWMSVTNLMRLNSLMGGIKLVKASGAGYDFSVRASGIRKQAAHFLLWRADPSFRSREVARTDID
jgi:hypothetical protein